MSDTIENLDADTEVVVPRAAVELLRKRLHESRSPNKTQGARAESLDYSIWRFLAAVDERTTDTRVEAAIETVARHAMAASMVEVICDCWESYPEVAELDWERVAERVATLAPYPPAADYQAAYKLLAGRADDE